MFYVSEESIKQAVRQIERWIYASKQDEHPGIAVLHANYAVGDLDMLRQMVSDEVVIRATGKNPFTLLAQATALQDEAQRKLLEICPQIRG